jgi:hypothetical protein
MVFSMPLKGIYRSRKAQGQEAAVDGAGVSVTIGREVGICVAGRRSVTLNSQASAAAGSRNHVRHGLHAVGHNEAFPWFLHNTRFCLPSSRR